MFTAGLWIKEYVYCRFMDYRICLLQVYDPHHIHNSTWVPGEYLTVNNSVKLLLL